MTTDHEILSRFPVGYYPLHPNVSLNFQMNRFWGWTGGEQQMLEELRAAGPRIGGYDDWAGEMLELSDKALADDRRLPAAYYARAAQFFLDPGDSRYEPARRRFLDNVLAGNGVTPDDHHLVPYQGTHLSAYRFTPARPRGTIIVFGGYDSYIVEWLPAALALRDAGLDTVIFDGPGQGEVLDAGTPMTPDWQLPTAAVLDHFGLDDVTLVGFSLGGGLVIRATAHEPRVARAIAFDICPDFFRALAGTVLSPSGLAAVAADFDRIPASLIDAAAGVVTETDLFTNWVIRHGERVMGADGAADLFQTWREYHTSEAAPLVTQDVLLMAGTRDHGIPLPMLGEQLLTLTAARSVTARVFTEAEQAQNHCQIGNTGLALKVILEWLDSVGGRTAEPTGGQ